MDDQTIFKTSEHLPEHRLLLQRILDYFRALPDVTGGFVSGSVAAGGMDRCSDLDVGVVCASAAARETIWARRWDWNIADWFHRFDADHIKPHFVIYLFEPGIKADLCLYTAEHLPPAAGAPFAVAWDATGQLPPWAARMNSAAAGDPAVDWAAANHEDERFWAWTFYCVTHIQRGEYYDVAADFRLLRNIVENWHARLAGRASFNPRRAEQREPAAFLARMQDCFPRAERGSCKRALQTLLALQDEQRVRIEALAGVEWTTKPVARERLRAMVEAL